MSSTLKEICRWVAECSVWRRSCSGGRVVPGVKDMVKNSSWMWHVAGEANLMDVAGAFLW